MPASSVASYEKNERGKRLVLALVSVLSWPWSQSCPDLALGLNCLNLLLVFEAPQKYLCLAIISHEVML
jgi:hypothetical protein